MKQKRIIAILILLVAVVVSFSLGRCSTRRSIRAAKSEGWTEAVESVCLVQVETIDSFYSKEPPCVAEGAFRLHLFTAKEFLSRDMIDEAALGFPYYDHLYSHAMHSAALALLYERRGKTNSFREAASVAYQLYQEVQQEGWSWADSPPAEQATNVASLLRLVGEIYDCGNPVGH